MAIGLNWYLLRIALSRGEQTTGKADFSWQLPWNESYNHIRQVILPKKAVAIINTKIITPIDHSSIRGDRYDP